MENEIRTYMMTISFKSSPVLSQSTVKIESEMNEISGGYIGSLNLMPSGFYFYTFKVPFTSYAHLTSLVSNRYVPRPSIAAHTTTSTTKSRANGKVPIPIRLCLSPSTP